ncbi:MAG: NAD(P)H-dependent oxidoreductase [Eubacteriales bacterium]
MKTVIVYNHPYEGSFNRAILDAVRAGLLQGGDTVDVIDLDAEKFNPVMTAADLSDFVRKKPTDPQVLGYGRRLSDVDRLVLIFPTWWSLMPALTKGFIDKVMFPGLAYEYGATHMTPLLLNLRQVTVITTMNMPRVVYGCLFGNPLRHALVKGTFKMMGYKNTKLIRLHRVKDVSPERRRRWLAKLEKRFRRQKI